MSLYYYEALPKEGRVDQSINLRRSTAIMQRTRDMLTPFYQYLDTAIKTLDKKNNIMARWRRVQEEGLVKLQPVDRLWRIEKRTVIRLLHNEMGVYRVEGNCDWDPLEPIRYRAEGGKKKGEFKVQAEDILEGNKLRIMDAPSSFDSVVWGYDTIQLVPAWVQVLAGDRVQVDGQPCQVVDVQDDEITLSGQIAVSSRLSVDGKAVDFTVRRTAHLPPGVRMIEDGENAWILIADAKPQGAMEAKLENYLSLETLHWEHDKSTFVGEKQDSGYLVFQGAELAKGIGKFVKNGRGLRFKVVDAGGDHQVRCWIQLLEMEEDDNEDLPGVSPLRYFFDDDIEIEDDKGNRYAIAKGYEGERKLLLYPKNQKGPREYCHPAGDILKVKVNTYQLRRQKDAVQALQDRPVRGHERLIKLFEDRKVVVWPQPGPLKATPFWQVLTDAERNGAKEQREFVQKALSTPDFAILEGPPGSGKTTVILELICQLVLRGKRILLCGSTHVAIDNVLERLKEKKLLENLSILPVRIGDENRISPAIKDFQLNNLQNDSNISEGLLLEASNLVCGTTIGILQHPDMKQFEGRWDEKAKKPIEPQFDYLIIDECSKTTFHEFLVPALYARHWILVGDVRQLSPFTDREQLVSNIHQMPLKGDMVLPDELQRACHYLFKMREMARSSGEGTKFIFVVTQKVLEYISDEWQAFRPVGEYKRLLIGLAGKNLHGIRSKWASTTGAKGEPLPPILAQPSEVAWMALAAADALFVEKECYQSHGDRLPSDMVVVNLESWAGSSHAFRVAHHTQRGGRAPYNRDRGKELHGALDIHEHYTKSFNEKTWADEIAWRIDREHQLRLKEPKKTRRLTEAIEELLPQSLGVEDDVANRLNTIASVALPSILEMLDRGLSKRKTGRESTLTEGFDLAERASRRTLLKYQQRMHPEISAFPRKQFYNNEALQDMDAMASKREWDYDGYVHRSTWLDVHGKTDRNYNAIEVQAMKRELQKFLDWATKNVPPADGRDNNEEWEVACLTFYRGQEGKIRDMLRDILKHQNIFNVENAFSSFPYQRRGGVKVTIKLHTVDKFQGQEADIVYLSMVQTTRDGFMDSPNRLNVAITRARYQMVILGKHDYFTNKSNSEDLKQLASHHSRNLIS